MNQSASLLLGEVQKVTPPFWPPRARKTAETAHFGPSVGKTESTAATPPKFRSFYPLELFGLIHKRPGQDPFFCQKPVFTHQRVRIHGASGTKLPFRCNSLRRSTPAGKWKIKFNKLQIKTTLSKLTNEYEL